MQELDAVISKALKFDALDDEERQRETRRSATIFEQSQPKRICADWYFRAPHSLSCQSTVQIDLERLLKYYDLSSLETNQTGDAKLLLRHFTREVDQYRQRYATWQEKGEESDLLCYLNFIEMLSQLFENSTVPFSYEHSGSSDKFRFEAINVLLTILAHYNNRALALIPEQVQEALLRKELSRSKARFFLLCTEVLAIIENHCIASAAMVSPQHTSKIVYQEAPRSLSMDPVKGVIVASMPSDDAGKDGQVSLSLDLFIESMLGGERSIIARRHLCIAKKHEALYDVVTSGQSLSRDPEGKLRGTILARISVINKAYKDAAELVRDCELNLSLYRHCRFMAHYWLCRAHYILAKHDSRGLITLFEMNQEGEEDLELGLEVLARLIFITDEAMRMEEKESAIMQTLDTTLDGLYQMMINDVQGLMKSFHEELYKKRSRRQKEMDFTLPLLSDPPTQQQPFVETRKNISATYFDQNPASAECRQLLRALNERLKQPTKGRELLITNTTSSKSSTTSSTKEQDSEESVRPMEKETKLEVFRERLSWLELFVANFDENEHEYVFKADLHERIKAEVKRTLISIEKVKNQQERK